jgi:acetyl-CoA C-acetyltransferase
MQEDPIVIVSSARTPMGAMLGVFTEVPAWELGGHVINAVCGRAPLPHDQVEGVIMGCVLSAGQGQAPARQAALIANISKSSPCLTLNKVCGSGLASVTVAHDLILAGRHEIMIAGGFENMSRAPYLLTKARTGYRLGNQEFYDHMFLDGLQDAYEKKLMGEYAEATATKFGFTRNMQDDFSRESLTRAKAAASQGWFDAEIVPVLVNSAKESTIIDQDETVAKLKPEKIATLKPAFHPEGTVTAANSSGIADGAAAHLLMRASKADRLGLKPLAKIVGHYTFAHEPAWFTTAPIHAIQGLVKSIDWTLDQVDLFEINEAFAVVTMVAIQELNLDPKKVNVNGGACALGHPIGASGARTLTTLLYALQHRDLHRGVVALCIGGGESVALAVERFAS